MIRFWKIYISQENFQIQIQLLANSFQSISLILKINFRPSTLFDIPRDFQIFFLIKESFSGVLNGFINKYLNKGEKNANLKFRIVNFHLFSIWMCQFALSDAFYSKINHIFFQDQPTFIYPFQVESRHDTGQYHNKKSMLFQSQKMQERFNERSSSKNSVHDAFFHFISLISQYEQLYNCRNIQKNTENAGFKYFSSFFYVSYIIVQLFKRCPIKIRESSILFFKLNRNLTLFQVFIEGKYNFRHFFILNLTYLQIIIMSDEQSNEIPQNPIESSIMKSREESKEQSQPKSKRVDIKQLIQKREAQLQKQNCPPQALKRGLERYFQRSQYGNIEKCILCGFVIFQRLDNEAEKKQHMECDHSERNLEGALIINIQNEESQKKYEKIASELISFARDKKNKDLMALIMGQSQTSQFQASIQMMEVSEEYQKWVPAVQSLFNIKN